MSWTIQSQAIGVGGRATFSIPEQHEFLGFRRTQNVVVVAYRVNRFSDFNIMVTLETCFVKDGFGIPSQEEADLVAFDPGCAGDIPMVLLKVKRR